MRDCGRHATGDGRLEFTYAAIMSSKIDRRLRRHTGLRQACTAPRWAVAVCAALAVWLSPGLNSAAADTDAEPSLARRLGAIAGSVYDKAESHLIAPSRQAVEELLVHPRTQQIYQQLSGTAQGLVALADTHVFEPISRGSADLVGRSGLRQSYERVLAFAGDLAEQLSLQILDPVIARLKHAGERAMATLPAPIPPRRAASAPPARSRRHWRSPTYRTATFHAI
jgi:hypothetical protein